MPSNSKAVFEFDDWKELAKNNPQKFEQSRETMIASIISNAPARYRHRLEGLQWRIDMERKRATNPLSACVRISTMMLDSLYGDDGLVKALNGNCKRNQGDKVAKVIMLGAKNKKGR